MDDNPRCGDCGRFLSSIDTSTEAGEDWEYICKNPDCKGKIVMNRLQEFVDANGGREHIRFIITTSALDYLPLALGLPFTFKSSGDEQIPVAFKIPDETEMQRPEDLYSLESNYKIELIPDTEENLTAFGRETFYQMDLLSMIDRGAVQVTQVTE